ncbi:VOC family protein [Pleionea sp. CnH1-48]|uniref:VOC family protein n=1 Tax=Pleionea sp. CnH1-48 TaxID=2954494 RepID=UPI0020982513|nr:VOC family protein [Pleionea sp. CnH1-48]MCO7224273.1 VOC family protein [Pleionea sp. CnH1-48]
MKIQQIHHVAYRCNDAKETVEFYNKVLGMNFILAIAEDKVPSTKEPDPYMHIFLDAGNGNILAFFELPNSPQMSKDPNTPEWVQHIALQVEDEDTLTKAKQALEAQGIEVVGPTNHEIIKSIYFFDPNGHRLELTTVTATESMLARLDEVKWEMLEEWSKTKKAPKQADWLHNKEFDQESA